MVRDAEAHSEEDARFEEMVTLRNQADGLVHAARKSLADAGDKASEEEKSAIETAATGLEEALKGDDRAAIEAKMQSLSEASASLAQKLYAEQAAEGAEGASASGSDGAADGGGDSDTVDAEFEEVKDDKKD
jgi:molecular chaperone DnaK